METTCTRLVQLFHRMQSVGYFAHEPVTDEAWGMKGYVMFLCGIVEALIVLRERYETMDTNLLLALLVYDSSIFMLDEYVNFGIQHVLMKWCPQCKSVDAFYQEYLKHTPLLRVSTYGVFTSDLLNNTFHHHTQALLLTLPNKWWMNADQVKMVENQLQGTYDKNNMFELTRSLHDHEVWLLFSRVLKNYIWYTIGKFGTNENPLSIPDLLLLPDFDVESKKLMRQDNPYLLEAFTQLEYPLYLYYLDHNLYSRQPNPSFELDKIQSYCDYDGITFPRSTTPTWTDTPRTRRLTY